jgi:hypothetical protein
MAWDMNTTGGSISTRASSHYYSSTKKMEHGVPMSAIDPFSSARKQDPKDSDGSN